MRWGQGFFRIWLVLSALWIGLAVLLNEPSTYKGLWRSVYEVGYKASDPRRAVQAGPWQNYHDFNLFKSRAELSAELTAWMQAQRPDIDSAELQRDRDRILADLITGHQTNLVQAKNAWMLTVIPPLALLGFGLCIFWIARGFRPRTPQRPLSQ